MSTAEPYFRTTSVGGCPAQPVQTEVNERHLTVAKVDTAALRKNVSGHPVYSRVKRAVDIATVVLAGPAALVVVMICAALILLLMGRPIFFVQNRVGRNGRVFRMYKLRSMQLRPAAESIATAKNDPRITPLGKFLRRSHLDEVPQLWNVLKGDMTLIGPRPEQPELVARYAELIPHYELRHLVTPGLSGWAQVYYGYAADVEETRNKLEHDLFYVQHYGPAIDLRTLIRTIVVYSNPMYVR
jgi:lipopolysaccharide/colanic/teichoic acid biosynthesis glycosyltransferase